MFVADYFLGIPVSHRRRDDLECSVHFLCVEVNFALRSAPVLLASVYHHRTVSSLASSVWIKLKKSLSRVSRSCSDFICAGDFNCHDISWSSRRQDSFGADWPLSALTVPLLCSIPSSVTINLHFRQFRQSLTWPCAPIPSLASGVVPLHDYPLDSDHYPLEIALDTDVIIPQVAPRTLHSKLDVDNANWNVFSDALDLIAPSVSVEVKFAFRRYASSPRQAIKDANSLCVQGGYVSLSPFQNCSSQEALVEGRSCNS